MKRNFSSTTRGTSECLRHRPKQHRVRELNTLHDSHCTCGLCYQSSDDEYTPSEPDYSSDPELSATDSEDVASERYTDPDALRATSLLQWLLARDTRTIPLRSPDLLATIHPVAALDMITELDLDCFGTLLNQDLQMITRLSSLELKSSVFDPILFGKFTNLTNLAVCQSGFTEFPLDICKLTRLKTLRLTQNNFPSVPGAISELQNLTDLYLWNNRICDIEPGLCCLTNLTRLWFANNKIKELPASIGNLTKLRHLNLDNNYLDTIPVEVLRIGDGCSFFGNPLRYFAPEFAKFATKRQVYDIALFYLASNVNYALLAEQEIRPYTRNEINALSHRTLARRYTKKCGCRRCFLCILVRDISDIVYGYVNPVIYLVDKRCDAFKKICSL